MGRGFVVRPTLLCALITGLLFFSGCGDNNSSTNSFGSTGVSFDATVCESLAGLEIDALSIDLPTSGGSVTSATWAVDAEVNYGQCDVYGEIYPVDPTAPNIEFRVSLPENWNGRALQLGGGGLNGSIRDTAGSYRYQPSGQLTPLQSGFVVLAGDSGHQTAGGSFALNAEALLNYGQQSIKKTHDAALAIVQAAFGMDPDYFYFHGFSQGGHEALDAAGRYPDDYDGVVSGTPALNVAMMHAGHGWVYKEALYADGGAGWVNPAKQTLLVSSVYAACDPIDGVTDGIISDIAGCLDVFDVQDLRCEGGANTGDDCLSDVEIETLDTLASSNDIGIDFNGNSVAAPFPIYNGGLLNLGRYSLGASAVPSNPAASTDAWHYQVGDTNAKYFITGNAAEDYVNFNIYDYEDRVSELAQIMDTTGVSFQRAHDNGVKVILFTGLADDGISPYNTFQFYERLVANLGLDTVEEFLKFYTIPGMSHGFGPFVAGYDSLPALMNWVENGVAPSNQVVEDTNAATAGRTRPLCEYPTWPLFTGTDENDASSFTCVY